MCLADVATRPPLADVGGCVPQACDVNFITPPPTLPFIPCTDLATCIRWCQLSARYTSPPHPLLFRNPPVLPATETPNPQKKGDQSLIRRGGITGGEGGKGGRVMCPGVVIGVMGNRDSAVVADVSSENCLYDDVSNPSSEEY